MDVIADNGFTWIRSCIVAYSICFQNNDLDRDKLLESFKRYNMTFWTKTMSKNKEPAQYLDIFCIDTVPILMLTRSYLEIAISLVGRALGRQLAKSWELQFSYCWLNRNVWTIHISVINLLGWGFGFIRAESVWYILLLESLRFGWAFCPSIGHCAVGLEDAHLWGFDFFRFNFLERTLQNVFVSIKSEKGSFSFILFFNKKKKREL